MVEVSRFECGECRYFGDKCKCIDHSKVHFARSCFSCDVHTAHHIPCSAFDPIEGYPAIRKEFLEIGGYWEWLKLFIEQWMNGKRPRTIGLNLAKPKEGRDYSDDIYDVPFDDFINLDIMKKDGIEYIKHRHIEKSRKSVTGYKWVEDGEGILTFEGAENDE